MWNSLTAQVWKPLCVFGYFTSYLALYFTEGINTDDMSALKYVSILALVVQWYSSNK